MGRSLVNRKVKGSIGYTLKRLSIRSASMEKDELKRAKCKHISKRNTLYRTLAYMVNETDFFNFFCA